MTSRERQLAAIRHEVPDRIPVDSLAVENQEAIAAALGIPIESVLERLGLDGRGITPRFTGELPPEQDGITYTEWGTPATGDYGTARAGYPLEQATSVAEVERCAIPDPAAYDFAEVAEQARAWGGQYAVRAPLWKPIFCRVCDLFGMERAMETMLSEPALFEAAVERVAAYTLEHSKRVLDVCGDDLPILNTADDFATQRGMMIAPESWRKFLKPWYAKLFALGKRRGKFIWFHSCGDISTVLPDLIEIGLDVWETVQLHTLPMSPRELKREFGKEITFFGGINTQRLPFASPGEVRDEVNRCIELLGEGGGYICGGDHHIKPDVPVGNTLTLYDTARKFRGAGYTRS